MIKEVLEVMIGLAKEGITMIVVTHEMNFAQTVANWVFFMDEGQILERNTPKEFFTNPRSRENSPISQSDSLIGAPRGANISEVQVLTGKCLSTPCSEFWIYGGNDMN